MLLTFSGLLTLLLDLSFITGQVAGGSVNGSQGDYMDCTLDLPFFTGNTSDNVTHEDDEEFQNQEKIHHYKRCNERLLKYNGESFCLCIFEKDMVLLEEVDWCDWEMVLGRYNGLAQCLEDLTGILKCYYPNTVVQDLFVNVHKRYFSACRSRDDILPDAPPGVVLILTLLPVSIIPFLVYMVIWKSSVSD